MGGITNTRPFGNFLVLKKILAHQDRLLKKSSKISVLVYFKSVISHPPYSSGPWRVSGVFSRIRDDFRPNCEIRNCDAAPVHISFLFSSHCYANDLI